jgi:hypothetical protein
MTEPRLCTVCGARVSNQKATTCDELCTRAKKSGLSRAEQCKRDEDAPYPTPGDHSVYHWCDRCGCRWCICVER